MVLTFMSKRIIRVRMNALVLLRGILPSFYSQFMYECSLSSFALAKTHKRLFTGPKDPSENELEERKFRNKSRKENIKKFFLKGRNYLSTL